ncbi:MAG: general L-amino acid transport system substrate-binding protein [Nitriliruptoraceae bacterium]
MRISKTWRTAAAVMAFGLITTACTSDPATDSTEEPTGDAVDDPTDPTTSDDASGSTADQVIARGSLICGVSGGLAGFSLNDGAGNFTGIDVDYCRGVAAAVLGDADAVQYVELTAETRFTALQSGEVDVLIRNGTWTASRDGELALQWATTTYYDGQGMLVNDSDAATEVQDMDGYNICVQTGTTTELNLQTYFDKLGITYVPVNVVDEAAVTENFSAGTCDAYTTDRSGLASFKSTYTGDDVKILPDVMSKEPLGPATRQGDDKWFDLVNWTVFATFQAEEFGITSGDVDSFDAGTNADIARFLGQEEGQTTGTGLGFPDELWAVRVITAIGNYQEIFDRNITPLGLDAGVNQLWTEGGLHYAPPFR